ncbi:MAG: hypothetical protein KDE27_16925 [Planctomycetes bacterium]|nr:hypothetical protein [Planctomycetota bacterium]
MKISFALLGALGLAAGTSAQVLVTSDITTSTTWTSNNVYNLQQQIYVRNGATLTIQAGTRIESTANLGGSLAVARGSKIEARGTERNPIVFTSTNDNGSLRLASNEWGNVTLMGDGYISEDVNAAHANTAFPDAGNFAFMEGLTGTSADQQYGGGNDDDNSGTMTYVSLRFGGKVIALTNELNGLSLGGVGRNTTLHHIEVFCNVDDGVEIWGGMPYLHHVVISNIGDDSFDNDQGWRGHASQVLICQGYSNNASQGSGHGDNAIEVDGAEQSDYQPVTRTRYDNFTIIGSPPVEIGSTGIFEPGSGSDHAFALRDNAGAQLNNSIIMDVGERIVSFDNTDGDGGAGYGFNGTMGWDAMWTTAYSTYPNVNEGPINTLAAKQAFYPAQTSGNLIQVKDCVIHNANAPSAFSVYNTRIALSGTNSIDNVVATASPIVSRTHGMQITSATGKIDVLTSLNPLPANDALNAVNVSPVGLNFRGAMVPGCNFANGWTALAEFGVLVASDFTDLGSPTAGVTGVPEASGSYNSGSGVANFALANAAPGTLAIGIISISRADMNLGPFGYPAINLVPSFPALASIVTFSNGSGDANFNLNLPTPALQGLSVYNQFGVIDNAAPQGVSASNATLFVVP